MSAHFGHLGNRASALLDGQLPADQEQRAWAHVAECQDCHDLVQRESWIKRRLACLSTAPCSDAPSTLKGDLLNPVALATGSSWLDDRHRRTAGFLAISTGAVGAAVLGVIAMGAGPAMAPTTDRRAPVVSPVVYPAAGPSVRPVSAPGRE